jgi:DMSO reductase anchor subunit
MNENFTSLVFFTVLSQTAVGALIFRWIALFTGEPDIISPDFKKISLLIITLLLLVSLAIAFFHLGNPVHAFSAINNLKRSWLSREILSLSLLMGTLLLYLVFVTINNSEKAEMIFSVISVPLSILLIYSMIKLYMIPSVITWSNPFTPVSFINTTLLCGILLLIIITGRSNYGFISAVTPLIAVLIISSLINSFLFPGSFFKQNINLLLIRISISILSLVLIALIYFKTQSNKTLIWWVIIFVTVMSSEIINRYIFFLSFDKSGL